MSLISFESACSRRSRSATGMGLPAFHESDSLNCRPGSMGISFSCATTSVAVAKAGRALAGIFTVARVHVYLATDGEVVP